MLCVHSKAQFASDRAQEDLSAMGPEEQLREFSSVVLPEETETPLDIVAKMVIVLINLGAEHLVQVRRVGRLDEISYLISPTTGCPICLWTGFG